MNYFTTIKAALDASFAGVCRHMGVTPTVATDSINRHLQTMNAEWFSGDRPTIAYRDPLCRFAYLFCHTAVNANLCEVAIRDSPDVTQLIRERLDQNQELRVCAFGGGPGTELLALAKLLTRIRPNGPVARLSFTLLDSVTEWSESWNALETQITAELRAGGQPFANWPFTVCKTFVPYDMTQVANYANMPNLFQQDLYVLNYVVSEVVGDEVNFQNVINTAAQSSPVGAKFLIIDRDQDAIREAATNLLTGAGLNVAQPVATSRNMDAEEQSDVLQIYINTVGRRPRVQWGRNGGRGAFWVVGTKV